MIEEADRDGDGEISEEEFMRIMRKTNLFWAHFKSPKPEGTTPTSWTKIDDKLKPVSGKRKFHESLYNLN